MFNPKDEPCGSCGREPDECVCGLTMDLLADPEDDLISEDLNWDLYTPDDDEDSNENEGEP